MGESNIVTINKCKITEEKGMNQVLDGVDKRVDVESLITNF